MLDPLPSPQWDAGTLIKHEEEHRYGVVIASYYFDDENARLDNEEWLVRVLVNEEIIEGWQFDWDDWESISDC